jgi:DNA primase
MTDDIEGLVALANSVGAELQPWQAHLFEMVDARTKAGLPPFPSAIEQEMAARAASRRQAEDIHRLLGLMAPRQTRPGIKGVHPTVLIIDEAQEL